MSPLTARSTQWDIAAYSACLETLFERCYDVRAAVLSTVDGLYLARRSLERTDASQMAAMTASMLSLGDVVANEGRHGRCRTVVVEAEQAAVLLFHAGESLILACVSKPQAKLGLLLHYSRECAESIAAVPQTRTPPPGDRSA